MLTFLKLGGSLITDKRQESTFRPSVMNRLSTEIASALKENPDFKLIIGHGSGSFGHMVANKYNTINGVSSSTEWRGFAKVATIASELNYLVANSLKEADLPIWRIQPSASALAHDGKIIDMSIRSIEQAIIQNLIPLVYGDVSLDEVRGGTIISTETILSYLIQKLPIKRIILLGEVDGVFDQSGNVIPHITPSNFESYKSALKGSDGVDVTGGMLTKVSDMLHLVKRYDGLSIVICNGKTTGETQQVLSGEQSIGTLITTDNN